MMGSSPIPDRIQVQNALRAILKIVDPVEAQKRQTLDSMCLLEAIRCCLPLSPSVSHLVERLAVNCNQKPNSASSGFMTEAIKELNTWLAKYKLPPVEKFSAIHESVGHIQDARTLDSPAKQTVAATSPPLIPLPQAWAEFVFAVRGRLLSELGPQPPFSRWMLPLPRWASRWIEAFAVVAADEHDSNTGFVLVPSEDAAASSDAERYWQQRFQTAQLLQAQTASPQIARVVPHREFEFLCGITLLRSEFARRTIADRIQGGHRLSPRECVELGISLCGILGALNAHGVHVIDLSPKWIAFDWSPGQRFTQLLDPTAVIPGCGLLPEWRGGDFGLAEATALPKPEVSQVFLIGAIVLSLLRQTNEEFDAAQFPTGRSATFACLSGSGQLADSHGSTIAAPLVADVEREAAIFHELIDAKAIVEALQWSVAERPIDRFDTLLLLSRALHKAVR